MSHSYSSNPCWECGDIDGCHEHPKTAGSLAAPAGLNSNLNTGEAHEQPVKRGVFESSDLLGAFRRVWSMPNSETFSVPAIGNFVRRYLDHSKESVDCFARNKRWAKWTNDLNPKTAAEYHMDVMDFLRLLRSEGVKADCVLFDPPYSPRQVKECYEAIGENCKQWMIQRQCGWTKERKIIRDILAPGGVVLSFGWNTVGMGKGFALEEILLVCHGGGHNDTICIAERALNAPNSDSATGG